MIKYLKNETGALPAIALILIAIFAVAVASHALTNQSPQSQISPQPNFTPAPRPEKKSSISPEEEQQKIAKYLTVEAALLGVADNASLYFKDLSGNYEFTIEPTKSWIPASTIKAYVVLEAFRQRNVGLINFDTPVKIKAENVVPTELESNEFPRLREGTSATIKQLIEAMVTQSDNTAYNSLLDILDRRNINLALRNIGITETVVGEKLNLDDGQFQTDLQVPGRQPNTTTVKDLATFFDLLYNHKIQSSDEMLAIFKRQKINNMIPALLPPNTPIAHKTGDWAPIYHDGGVIFKPDDPFILTVFTNSGDPTIISKLAEVAYLRTPDSVGKPISFNVIPTHTSPYEKLAMTPSSTEAVLGEQTPSNQKFPTITAEDLGINFSDLTIGPKAAQNLRPAWIIPGSLLYEIKTFIEGKQLEWSVTNRNKVTAGINLAKDKLSEVKTVLEDGDITKANSLLNESEGYLAKATELAQNDPQKDLLLVEIKQVNDLHYAVLNQEGEKLSQDNKSQFIDTVYNFYQKNHTEVTPIINTSVIANPLQQKPAIGTVTDVKDKEATIKFDDGTSREVILTDNTKVRSFQQTEYQDPSTITKGDKVAVVGLTGTDSKIISEFILKNVPKELPAEHSGTVIEINPDGNTLKILNNQGKEEVIKIEDNTNIKSKDTAVSLDGITIGSQVTAFGVLTQVGEKDTGNSINGALPASASGTVGQPATSALSTPGASSQTTIPTSGKPSSNAHSDGSNESNGSKVQTPSPSSTGGKPIELKATTITVTGNGSGKDEVVKVKEPENKPAPKNDQPAKPSDNGSAPKNSGPSGGSNNSDSKPEPKDTKPDSKDSKKP